MAALFTPEIISMLGGSILGFVMKFLSIRAEERAAQFDRMMKAIDKSDESADKAAARAPGKEGQWVRRIIVVSILFGVILAPFLLALLNEPTVAQIAVEKPKYFFGLFGGGTKTAFVEIKGYLMVEELRSALLAIISFYFGQSAAKSN